MQSSNGWDLESLLEEVVTKESSLTVDNNDGHKTIDELSSSMVAKKESTLVVQAIHSLAKPDKCKQQAGTVLSSSG